MKELIDEMSYDLAECHVDYLDDAKLYTDYDTMAQKMVSRGYRKQSENTVEIVRCRDCIYFTEGMAVGMCKRIEDKPIIPIVYDHFCGYGERRVTDESAD